MSGISAAIRADFQGLAARLGLITPRFPTPGLHSYRQQSNGGRTCLHLRVQNDGSGLLFVDVGDVLHLSESATYLAWLALERVEPARAIAWALGRWRGTTRKQIASAYARTRQNIEALATPGDDCRTCRIELEHVPLFSTPTLAPHKVDIALTYACNNACPHCYNDPARFDVDSLGTDQWRQVLDRLARIGVPHVIFTGGEPTLHPDLPTLVRHARDLGMIVGLNTNGRRLQHRNYAHELAEAGLEHVQITLHSHLPQIHDTMVATRCWQQTVDGIRAALDTPLHVITNSTLTLANCELIEETVDLLHDLGLKTFACNALISSGGGDMNSDAIAHHRLPPILMRVRDRAQELGLRFLWYTVTEYCEMSPLELDIGTKRCNAGEYSMCIDTNGDVLPCQSYYVSAGNMLHDDWQAIWNSDLFRSFRHRQRDPRHGGLPDRCADCPDLPLCGGGCRLERESKQGRAPGGCQSCASGSVRSSGASVAARCQADTELRGGSC